MYTPIASAIIAAAMVIWARFLRLFTTSAMENSIARRISRVEKCSTLSDIASNRGRDDFSDWLFSNQGRAMTSLNTCSTSFQKSPTWCIMVISRKDYKNALKKTLCWEQIAEIFFWHIVGLPLYMKSLFAKLWFIQPLHNITFTSQMKPVFPQNAYYEQITHVMRGYCDQFVILSSLPISNHFCLIRFLN